MIPRAVLLACALAPLWGCSSVPVRPLGALESPGAPAIEVYRVDLDDERAAGELDRVLEREASAGRRVALWIDVGRSVKLADEHPTWIAGIGAHADWRRKHLDAPAPGPGERIGVYPWITIWYREVLEHRRDAIYRLLRGREGRVREVFLAHVQGAPSACGCGNDQCRWTTDYRMPGGPQRVAGAPAALLVNGLKKDLPGVEWIPVWVTECEEIDQPGDGSTGYCGTVGCFSGLCWKESTKEMEALLAEAPGRIALVAGAAAFSRDLPRYGEPGSWAAAAMKEVAEIPPAHGRTAWLASRLIAVIESNGGRADRAPGASQAIAPGAQAILLVEGVLDEAWEPRIIPSVTPTTPPVEGHGHD